GTADCRSRPSARPARGCSSMAELQPSKLAVRVRFPSPARSGPRGPDPDGTGVPRTRTRTSDARTADAGHGPAPPPNWRPHQRIRTRGTPDHARARPRGGNRGTARRVGDGMTNDQRGRVRVERGGKRVRAFLEIGRASRREGAKAVG